MEIKMIPIDKIRPSPFQPRETFDKDKIAELADSIKGNGLVQPILVRKKGDTYQIIAGERRWRAYQFAGLKEIPAIEREVDDIEARELSLIENWHRLELEPGESEKFIAALYEEGRKEGRYKAVKDMAKITGISLQTLESILTSYEERKELGIAPGSKLTYTDFRETRLLKEQPELREKVLELREKGKLKRDDLREFSKTVKEVSEPLKKVLLKDDSKITPEEARVIDSELTDQYEKERAIKMIEEEKSPERVRSLVHVVKTLEEERERKAEFVETATGDIWICPICNKEFRLIHVDPTKTHRLEEVIK